MLDHSIYLDSFHFLPVCKSVDRIVCSISLISALTKCRFLVYRLVYELALLQRRPHYSLTTFATLYSAPKQCYHSPGLCDCFVMLLSQFSLYTFLSPRAFSRQRGQSAIVSCNTYNCFMFCSN